jgi:hypothetical protein
MDFKNILSQIEKTDSGVYEKLSDRRDILKSFGTKVAVAALPFAIGSMFNKAYGKTTSGLTDVLNFALQLEYLEYNFYHIANNVVNLIPAADQAGFLTIEAHEKAHINFLKTTITAMGGIPFTPNHYSDTNSTPPYVPNAYDFRASANTAYSPVFAQVFSDYRTFLVAAQTIEDTGIRAYNGQMVELVGNPLFTQVQQVLGVEGRHAAFIRLIRRNMGAQEVPASWINNNIPPTSPVAGSNNVLQPFYNGEENTRQLNVSIDALAGIGGNIPASSASAAFDEGLSKATVLSLLGPFILT